MLAQPVPVGVVDDLPHFHVNQRAGLRWSAAKAFLRSALRRSNLTVLTNVTVERVILAKVTGVQALVDGEVRSIAARREVILAAGSIGSPSILQWSGIGPGEEALQPCAAPHPA
jgi:choline dehydrogenase